MSDTRRGVLAGFGAYLIWGMFPLFWPLLEPAGAAEILAHRIIWSALCMALVVVAARRVARLKALARDRRTLLILAGAAIAISVNWGTYIWAVNAGHVVEASLGYFINPLVSVAFGVLLLGERLRRAQWVAVGIAVIAVIVLAVDHGRPPWIALTLAVSFATYGLAKKRADAGAFESLALETTLLTPLALVYVAFLASTGDLAFGAHGLGHVVLLMTAGLLTAVPLVLFGAAATRMSLVSLGLLQYLAPILQFAIGVLVYSEAMPPVRWIGFALVWAALILFTFETINHRRKQLLLATTSSAV